MTALALYNGLPTQTVPSTNRAVAYGDGLFETIKVETGRAQFLPLHLRRLIRDCARLDIALDEIALRSEIAQLLSQRESGVLKIIVMRESFARGYFAPPHSPSARLLQFFPQVFVDDERSHLGVAVRLCRQQLSEQPSLAGIKHLNRLEQVLARSEWSETAIAEGFMFDRAGRLIEGTMSNVFLVRANKLYTPRLHRCGVAGVMREIILTRLAPELIPAIETDLLPIDIAQADDVFICNSLIGIWPVRKIECLQKTVGDVTLALQQKLTQLIADEAR
ncbi:MAG: aminodeoxychorismate lyase [Verrucomicrobiaceae bacterium]|nr:aminodeoxychorismate lyase [Verrucomicrobiaceae bacterium]